MWDFFRLFCAVVLVVTSLSVFGAGTREQRIPYSQWPQYVNGPNIAALPQVQEILSGFDEQPGNEIIVRFPGGSAGKKWAEQMRDWFVSYGVPLDYLKMEAGSGAPDQLLLILINRF